MSRTLLVAILTCLTALSSVRSLHGAQAGELALGEFRAAHGSAWTLERDGLTGRPRRLSGGVAPLTGPGEDLGARALSFLSESADLLALEVVDLREVSAVSTDDDHLQVVHFVHAPHGVPVEGSLVSVVVLSGNVAAVHAVGTQPVLASSDPATSSGPALDEVLVALRRARDDVRLLRPVELRYLQEEGSHRLAWRVELTSRAPAGPRHVGFVDAGSGVLLSLLDESVDACDPPPTGGFERRALGGVRPVGALDDERRELLPFVTVGSEVAGADGFFSALAPPYGGVLSGPAVSVSCVDCTDPIDPLAPAGPDGDVDFGFGGLNAVGNGLATPADRSSYFHSEAVLRQAKRWLDLPWFDEPLQVFTNVEGDCNAFWNGTSLNFKQGSASCSNAGEIKDVIAHEWGHGLDSNDGLPPSSLSVDAATGEAVADIVALLHSRDACVGESFFLDPGDFPSTGCSGVRDLDEHAAGHRRGSPATLSVANVVSACSSSAYYRGVLGREGHCEGEILGQAFWHLVQNLRTGVSYSDGSAIPNGVALGEEDAWQLAESLFYRSRMMLASYAPSSLQSIGMSAYEAFLLADDEGDGIANGTPHAWAIHEAFLHHGIAESALAPPLGTPCAAPSRPFVTATTVTDASTGLPSVQLNWTEVGADGYQVLRADDTGDAMIPLTPRLVAGTREFVDRGVLPGRLYDYVVIAESASGCLSSASGMVTGSAGAFLEVAGLTVDDIVGNGDGLLAPGETADLWLEVVNRGSSPATDLTVELVSDDPLVPVLVAGPIVLGTLAPGASTVAPMPFQVQALAGAPLSALLTFNGEAVEGCLVADWLLPVVQPKLVVTGHVLDDSGGSGDGVWDPGETVLVPITLRNDGTLDAAPVAGLLSFRGAPTPGITILDSAADWNPIVVGTSETTLAPSFSLLADPTVIRQTTVPLTLDVDVDGQPHASHDIDLLVGGFPPGLEEWSTPTADIAPLGTGQAVNLPLIVQSSDDNGDGVIDGCDIPDVIFEVWNIGARDTIVRLSGDDGRHLGSFDVTPCRGGWTLFQALAAGDVDDDGFPEILTEDSAGRACAFELDGTLQWKSDAILNADFRPFWGRAAPQVWDVDRDSLAEVVIGHGVVNGEDGSIEWAELDPRGSGRALVGDLDLDGSLEIISNHGDTRSADGSLLGRLFPGFWSQGGLVNADADPEPEVVYVAWTDQPDPSVVAREHDGTFIYEWFPPMGADMRCAPCFGDFDGDGLAETALPIGNAVVALDEDGTLLWSAPVNDGSGAAGCSVFDFEVDGRPEIVFRDEDNVMVLDGLTGDRLWQVASGSQTQGEFPLVADVDGDGSAEIVIHENLSGNRSLVRSFGNPRWPPARGTWNQESYSVTHVNEDGTVVPDAAPRWLGGNDFRGQAVACPCGGPTISLTASDVLCGSKTACFTAEFSGGFGEVTLDWDYGDGSDEVAGATTCHSYATAGTYTVIVSLMDEAGCPAEATVQVDVPEVPEVSVSGDVACADEESCFTAMVSGGAEPVEIEWSFDDGAAWDSRPSPCYVFPGPTWSATVFVRDANGCLAEATLGGSFTAGPPSVGSVLYATDHGDPYAPDIEGTFEWLADEGGPRPADQTYLILRGDDPQALTRVPGTEGQASAMHVDSTPASASLPFVHFYKVFAEDACGASSEN